MNNTGLTCYSRLDYGRIKYNNYTQSLIGAAYEAEIFAGTEVERLQMDLMNTLSYCILLYTKGESASIRNETAAELLQSILYTIDTYLIDSGTYENGIELLRKTPMKDLYHFGLKRLQRAEYETAGLLAKAKRTKISLPNTLYNNTISRDIIDCLKQYNRKFNAHLVIGTLDYPLAVPIHYLRGIAYLHSYTKYLVCENEFCQQFSPFQLKKLYHAYCERENLPLKAAWMNVFEPVFFTALFADDLCFTRSACNKIENSLRGMEETEILNYFLTIIQKWKGNQHYFQKILQQNFSRILTAIQNNNLSNVGVLTTAPVVYV